MISQIWWVETHLPDFAEARALLAGLLVDCCKQQILPITGLRNIFQNVASIIYI
ncbi:MAG: hypothetical protein ACD_20C00042G0007 [uncultured bacterium]|nr:MAG: hypothetical protein ACD_20C00042G0007 [uncultured bacterium]